MNIYKNNYTASFAIIVLTFLVFVVSKGLMLFWDYFVTIKHYNLILIIYGILFIASLVLTVKIKNKTTSIIFQVIAFPLSVVAIFAYFALPILAIQFATIFYIIFSMMIPLILCKVNEFYQFIQLSTPTNIYLILTTSSLIAIVLSDYIKKLVISMPPFGAKDSKKIDKIKMKELLDFVLSTQNIRFFIYFFYFIYLIVYNIGFFENSPFFGKDYENSVLQAFITYIAFDSLSTNFSVKSQPVDLLKKILSAITSSFPNLDNKESAKSDANAVAVASENNAETKQD